MTTLVVLQPGYLPWLGFFDQMRRADVFVYYDDVQFDKNGWRNRNRVKSPAGQYHWLTVPVIQSGRSEQRIDEVEIDNRAAWPRKHLGTIAQFYGAAPHRRRYLPQLEELLTRPWESLVELDIATTALLCEWLGLACSPIRSSELDVSGDPTGRLVGLCRHFGADRYLSGSSGRDYLDVPAFEHEGVDVVWQDYHHPEYPQLHGEFLPYLSVLDLLLNCGEQSLEIIAQRERGENGAQA